MNAILAGAIVMAAGVIALFFLRYWRQTRDRFFLYFALAFVLEGSQRLLAALRPVDAPDEPQYYVIRLAAYGLILIAIIGKNRRPPPDT
ncbi:hypothetical protein GM668_27970 [Duganella ginsengisoli]|uniref:Uncharacterized protein n=1 Tax=Pseudoduganella ginsengisoli TaxID=1462440 RepID=A0A6L6Q9L1_9BURK|nr:hypothetical protein [Pseudoduganella ginsengisoli]